MAHRRSRLSCPARAGGARGWDPYYEQAAVAELLATVASQDTEPDPKGAGPCAHSGPHGAGPVTSTVDPETRHAHKTRAQRRDGWPPSSPSPTPASSPQPSSPQRTHLTPESGTASSTATPLPLTTANTHQPTAPARCLWRRGGVHAASAGGLGLRLGRGARCVRGRRV